MHSTETNTPVRPLQEQGDTLNAIQAAALLFADPDMVLGLARQGKLPGTKIGKSWVFLREDVLNFLRARVREDTEERLRRIESQPEPVAIAVERRPGRRRRPPPVLPGFPNNSN